MATTDLTAVFTTLFTAPAHAAAAAEREYRTIWLRWLADLATLIDAAAQPMSAEQLAAHLDLAPVLGFESLIDVGVTMRVASVNETRAGLSAGLRLGAIDATGSFAFMSRASQESILQARTQYTLATGARMTLADYLQTLSIQLASPEDVRAAIDALERVPGVTLPAAA